MLIVPAETTKLRTSVGVELGPHLTQCCPGPRTTIVPNDMLIHPAVWPRTIDMGRKSEDSVPFWLGRGAGFPQCRLGRGLRTFYQVASWPIESFGHNIWAENLGGLSSLEEGDLGVGCHLTQCGQDRGRTCIPCFIWIRRTVWPQYTSSTDRT